MVERLAGRSPSAGDAGGERPGADRADRRPERWSSERPTEQAHLVRRRAGRSTATTPTATRWPSQPGARRRHVEPAVPGGPRGAGPGLLGVLVPRRVRGRGGLGVYAGTAPERADEVLERHRRRARPPGRPTGSTEHELAVAKGHLEGSTLLGLEDSGGRMSRIGRQQLVHGEVADGRRAVACDARSTPVDARRRPSAASSRPRRSPRRSLATARRLGWRPRVA